MKNWNRINREIEKCLSNPDPISCLSELFIDTQDGWVAYNLAEEYRQVNKYHEALEFYEKAYNLLPLPKYKKMASEKIKEMRSILERIKETSYEKEKSNVLFIVMCTKKKIWSIDNTVSRYIPAKDAYKGESFKKWLDSEESKKYNWLILSAKYGFIEPDHPIGNYDVSFNDGKTGPISIESLIRQVLYQERLGLRLRDVRKVYVVGNETYFKKVKIAFSPTDAEVIHYEI